MYDAGTFQRLWLTECKLWGHLHADYFQHGSALPLAFTSTGEELISFMNGDSYIRSLDRAMVAASGNMSITRAL